MEDEGLQDPGVEYVDLILVVPENAEMGSNAKVPGMVGRIAQHTLVPRATWQHTAGDGGGGSDGVSKVLDRLVVSELTRGSRPVQCAGGVDSSDLSMVLRGGERVTKTDGCGVEHSSRTVEIQ